MCGVPPRLHLFSPSSEDRAESHPPGLTLNFPGVSLALFSGASVTKCHKLGGGLKQQKCRIHSQSQRPVSKSKVVAGLAPSWGWEGQSTPGLSPSFRWLLASLAVKGTRGCVTPVSASAVPQPSLSESATSLFLMRYQL